MPINQVARLHLETFAKNEPFPGGLSFRKAMMQSALDYTLESLSRVDYLLDQIRTRIKPDESKFWDTQDNQNFANFLCFYVGSTVARVSRQKIVWYEYGEMIELMPENALTYPACFATHITCVLERKGFFVPLSAIQVRLFDEPPGKSVRASAEPFI